MSLESELKKLVARNRFEIRAVLRGGQSYLEAKRGRDRPVLFPIQPNANQRKQTGAFK